MIIIKVQGGLGNQLLQYSIGRVLSTLYSKEVAYDISVFEHETKYTTRPYLLDKFIMNMRVATNDEIRRVRYPYGIVSKMTSLCNKLLNKFIFKKYYIGYDEHFLELASKKSGAYFEGYWQSYQYYKNSLEILSDEITLRDTTHLRKIKDDISFDIKNSVAVHIRRGDYLKAGVGLEVLTKEYYVKAVAEIEKQVENPTYYIFSDDSDYVKKEMGELFKDVVFVSTLNLTDYEEFSLLKECHHAIIANSTFSWFPSLLRNPEGKVVVAPKDWKNSFLKNDINLCPMEWIRV